MSPNTPTKVGGLPRASGLGLDGLGDLSSLVEDPGAANNRTARPLELPLHLIEEDPDQPRKPDNPGFSPESLAELAATIRDRGVKSPISVREHPEVEGRFIINHGTRRYRASQLAGKTTIPAFVDNDHNQADQIIENLHRNELTAREIADFIGRELAKGKRKRDIAKEIGKSPAFVTQHVTLLDLPDPIAEAFNAGRVKDVTLVNELVTAYKKNNQEVATWLGDDSQELTRGSVKLLREFLDRKNEPNAHHSNGETAIEDGYAGQPPASSKAKREKKTPDKQDLFKKPIVQVRHEDRQARLILNRRPPQKGWAWLRYEEDGRELAAELATVQLVALIEG
jgi:ParB family chromosome partitioning protein